MKKYFNSLRAKVQTFRFKKDFFNQNNQGMIFCFVVCSFLLFFGCGQIDSRFDEQVLQPIRTIEQLESYRAKGLVPKNIERIYCSGGTLRLAVYLGGVELVIATDGNERITSDRNGMKAYLAAHPDLAKLPVAGESSGRDQPELLLALKSPPQLIIKADTGAGYDPVELTRRTGIPVLLVPMRGITVGREQFDAGLRLIGAALNKTKRAEDIIAFFDKEITELKQRTTFDNFDKITQDNNQEKSTNSMLTKNVETKSSVSVYVGGVSYNGSHGFNSSESGYPPFELVGARSFLGEKKLDPILGNRHVMLAKEKILDWNPDKLFLDLGTLALGDASGLAELKTDAAYRSLDAVKKGEVYTLLPNTFYFVNHDAVLVNAWFVGKILYPEQFKDIDPKKKADEIFEFLVGKPVFDKLNNSLQNTALERLSFDAE
ncbi:MAG: ABC transporter substrate-binding protein [Planctomycetaceae bacterium]|jgi:iron complex transport system substrate-binding protein|nr:ABC transporter substrate-binding protein [Planctomycetaceae bacterium]